MRKVTVSRMRKRYAQTVLTFRITYVYVYHLQNFKFYRLIQSSLLLVSFRYFVINVGPVAQSI